MLPNETRLKFPWGATILWGKKAHFL
jgi:hypothetical protein